MSELGYQPKGGMCATCSKIKNDCSELPFETYPKIGRYKDGLFEIVLVKCLEHKPNEVRDE